MFEMNSETGRGTCQTEEKSGAKTVGTCYVQGTERKQIWFEKNKKRLVEAPKSSEVLIFMKQGVT